MVTLTFLEIAGSTASLIGLYYTYKAYQRKKPKKSKKSAKPAIVRRRYTITFESERHDKQA